MRLFIAIPIPTFVTSQLTDLCQPIDGLRWQDEDKMHLTLKFLGDTDDEKALELQERLASIDFAAFTLTIKGLGYFPKGKHPKVVWAGLERNSSLLKLQRDVEQTCSSMGFEAEDRPYHPHITLGRVKGASKRDVLSFINEHKQFQIPNVPIEEFVLFESKLDSEGAIHNRLKTYKLIN